MLNDADHWIPNLILPPPKKQANFDETRKKTFSDLFFG